MVVIVTVGVVVIVAVGVMVVVTVGVMVVVTVSVVVVAVGVAVGRSAISVADVVTDCTTTITKNPHMLQASTPKAHITTKKRRHDGVSPC